MSQSDPETTGPAGRGDEIELSPGIEPLTPEEKERFLAQARAQGRNLTSKEQYAIFGPPPQPAEATPLYEDVAPMEQARLDQNRLAQLQSNFFPELGSGTPLPQPSLVRGVIFDFDFTLAQLTRPLEALMDEGARAAGGYMRSTGMELPPDFHTNIVEARRFAEEKSEEEHEEHLADDALSFLLQFFGYPASQMNPDVLRRAVDIFYAPEMTAWQLLPGAREMLAALRSRGYRLALLANYNCDRVFQRTVDYLGIRPFFDVCLASASVEYRKPDPRYFQIVLNRWDALPYEVVVAGDSLRHDVQGGLDLGALAVQIQIATPPDVVHDNARLAGQVVPDASIDDLSRLPVLVNVWAKA